MQVFGSVARGEVTEESDIDFLADYDLEKITPWFLGGLLLDLGVNQMEKRIPANSTESQTIESIRNALLPQLLSGKIRIKDAEKVVEAVM